MAEKEGLHQRLKQAIVWLKQNKNILQLDIAEKMGMTTVGLSRGLARCKEKNDEDFVIKFHQATDEVFSLDWLLHGTGEKFTADINKSASQPASPASSPIDPSSILNAALAAQMQTIESLKSEKATLLEVHARELKAKDDLIQSLRDQLAVKDQLISDKNALIRARDSRILELERQLAAAATSEISRYPFTMGAAEDNKQPQI
jgi:DNA-binding transcriptional regulator LsrR (DeoR family)